MSHRGLHPQPAALARVSEATGVQVVMGCGWYHDRWYPELINTTSTDALAELIVRDLAEGVDGTGIRPGIIGEIGVRKIREKSLRQTARVIELVDEHEFKLNTPREPERRGGSVVFDFPAAASVARELNARHFYCDHRPGAGIRISPHFYNSDEEVELFFAEVDRIRRGGGRE